MYIVEISDLTKRYKDLTAVNSLNLVIKKGDVHGILGPNGAGKSTLISCIVGINETNHGTVRYENGATLKKWRSNIGYIPQELAIYPELSAYDNVKFFASLYGLKGEKLEKEVSRSLDFVGLTEVKNKKSAEFSGGMKRRLNLACAITHSPKLIIMDEPTVGIDPQSRNRIMDNVKQLNQQGVTIIYTTHYMEEVESICNSITVIDKGNVIADGSKEDIMQMMGKGIVYLLTVGSESKNWKAFMEKAKTIEGVTEVTEYMEQKEELRGDSCLIRGENTDIINNVIDLAVQHKLVVKNISHKEPSLEEIFLELTGKELRDK